MTKLEIVRLLSLQNCPIKVDNPHNEETVFKYEKQLKSWMCEIKRNPVIVMVNIWGETTEAMVIGKIRPELSIGNIYLIEQGNCTSLVGSENLNVTK